MRLAGAEYYDIRAHADEQGWNCSERTIRRYMAAGDRLLKQSLEMNRKKLLRRHIAQRRTLFARATQDGDWRTALAIARDEAELERLYQSTSRVEVTGKNGKDLPATIIQFVNPKKPEPSECHS